MNRFLKLLTLFLVLLMLVQSSVISIFAFSPIEVDVGIYQAVTGTGYAQTSDVKYVYSGEYVYNWGYRGETATFLSPMAVNFYSSNSNYDYDVLSLKNGSSSESSVPSSEIYKALQTLMKNEHNNITSYNATKSLYQYTDCQLSGINSKKISSFYSGKEIGPSWDGGSTWNREHTWPNSKGDAAGQGENDIMMLRPASVSENSSRGNAAYGESSGYFNPNKDSNGKYIVKSTLIGRK